MCKTPENEQKSLLKLQKPLHNPIRFASIVDIIIAEKPTPNI